MQKSKAMAAFSPRKRGEGALAPARKKLKVPYIFIFLCMSPWIFGIIIFTAYPMIASFYQSFTKFNLIDKPEWIGLDNFHRMFFEDDEFLEGSLEHSMDLSHKYSASNLLCAFNCLDFN